MYCMKCGNEVKHGEEFCPKCGTKVGTSGKGIIISSDDIKNKLNETASKIPEMKDAIPDIKQNVLASIVSFGKSTPLFFANIISLILSLVFSLAKPFKVAAVLGISQGMSIFEGVEAMGDVFVVFYIISILFLLVPLLLKKEWKRRYFYPERITLILMLFWFFIVFRHGTRQIDSSTLNALAEFDISASGWFFIIFSVVALILSFKLVIDLKKAPLNELMHDLDAKQNTDENE